MIRRRAAIAGHRATKKIERENSDFAFSSKCATRLRIAEPIYELSAKSMRNRLLIPFEEDLVDVIVFVEKTRPIQVAW
jgi:hypothetical protein